MLDSLARLDTGCKQGRTRAQAGLQEAATTCHHPDPDQNHGLSGPQSLCSGLRVAAAALPQRGCDTEPQAGQAGWGSAELGRGKGPHWSSPPLC